MQTRILLRLGTERSGHEELLCKVYSGIKHKINSTVKRTQNEKIRRFRKRTDRTFIISKLKLSIRYHNLSSANKKINQLTNKTRLPSSK